MSKEALAGLLFLISNISFVLAAVCLALAVIFFVVFKIPLVIGELSGRTAHRSVERMRASNEKRSTFYRPGRVETGRGKRAAPVKTAGKSEGKDGRPETGLLAETGPAPERAAATELLAGGRAGAFPDGNTTGPLADETTPLAEAGSKRRGGGVKLEIIEEILLIHTDEVIAALRAN